MKPANKTAVLIVAGGDISRKLPYLRADCACPALIPLNTRPLASYVLGAYGKDYDIHLIVDEQFVDEVSRELPPRKHGFKLHGVKPSSGVVTTLRQALAIEGLGDDIIVNLVTSIPTSIPSPAQVQVSSKPAHTTTDWAAISSVDDLHTFHPKGVERPDKALAFTGVFRFSAKILREAVNETTCDQDLLFVIQKAAKLSPITLQIVDWIDCGHETNYYKSRAQLINSRSFNRLKVDSVRSTITKSSDDNFKLSRETAYIETLPVNLSILFPRVIGVSGSLEHIDSYEMEYYGYPNLAEYLLYWDLSKESWWRCFDSLSDIITLFRHHPTTMDRKRYLDFHWRKTVSRIDEYLGNLADSELATTLRSGHLTLNDQKLMSLDSLLAQAEIVISKGYRESNFSVFHGDFCFNNILFDVASGVTRLIDPRGSFGEECPGIYGDWRYDLAKLAHSSIGNYDYFVNGLFDVWSPAAGKFRLETVLRPNNPWLVEMTHWIIKKQQADPHEIEVMTGLLFLSMCPLHQDDSSRQLAFFLRGMEILHNCFDQN